jgi:hypothetical protein
MLVGLHPDLLFSSFRAGPESSKYGLLKLEIIQLRRVVASAVLVGISPERSIKFSLPQSYQSLAFIDFRIGVASEPQRDEPLIARCVVSFCSGGVMVADSAQFLHESPIN